MNNSSANYYRRNRAAYAARSAARYAVKKEDILSRQRARGEDRSALWGFDLAELKSAPCKRCGGKFPAICMDFHHRNPLDKSFNIGSSAWTSSRERLLAEIAKCDILCANCHRLVDHEELKNAPPEELVLLKLR